MDTNAALQEILTFLEQVRQRPGAWIGPHVEDVVPFLQGFTAACAIFGMRKDGGYRDHMDTLQAIVVERGWAWSSHGIVTQMHTHGWSYQQIIDEALLIEATLWQRLYQR